MIASPSPYPFLANLLAILSIIHIIYLFHQYDVLFEDKKSTTSLFQVAQLSVIQIPFMLYILDLNTGHQNK